MNDREAPFSHHLVELRRRLTISALALVVGAAVTFSFHRQILNFLLESAKSSLPPGGNIVYTEITEFLGVAMKVSLLGGLVLAMPVILYQVVMFISPALKPAERRYLFALLPACLLAFAAGAAFSYKVLTPPAMRFLVTFGSDVATPMIRIGNLVNLMITLLFWSGVIFQTPIVMFFLAKIGIVNHRSLARWRRFAVVGAFVLSAIITPTFDPINQTLMALPIIVLYELGIWLAWLARRPKPHPSKETMGTGG